MDKKDSIDAAGGRGSRLAEGVELIKKGLALLKESAAEEREDAGWGNAPEGYVTEKVAVKLLGKSRTNIRRLAGLEGEGKHPCVKTKCVDGDRRTYYCLEDIITELMKDRLAVDALEWYIGRDGNIYTELGQFVATKEEYNKLWRRRMTDARKIVERGRAGGRADSDAGFEFRYKYGLADNETVRGRAQALKRKAALTHFKNETPNNEVLEGATPLPATDPFRMFRRYSLIVEELSTEEIEETIKIVDAHFPIPGKLG